MASEDTLIDTRKEKHQELNGTTYPLFSSNAVDFTVQHLLSYVSWQSAQTSLDPKELGTQIALHGRIAAIRKSGGITFVKLTDQTGSIQLIFSKAVISNYDRLRLLDLGDIFQVSGPVCLSKTGEKSVLVMSWQVLAKAHRPPPEKFAGIQDTELKHRKRYLDLMSSEESRARFTIRAYVLRALRKFMDDRDFLEVETPTLASISSGANAKPFTTHSNALDIDLNLRIAPELNLKRLLVGGFDKVYELGRAYRNEGIDTRHNPEFTMIESYQAYGKFSELLDMTKLFILYVHYYLMDHLPVNVKVFYHKWRAESPVFLEDFAEVTMAGAVEKACSKANICQEIVAYDLFSGHLSIQDTILGVSINDTYNERVQRIDVKGMFNALSECTSNGEKFAVLFEYVAEPFLTEDYRTKDGTKSIPVFITEYPKEISPLARTNDQISCAVDRFELFVDGRELANAFQELNDPGEQALRFKEQLESNQKDAMAYDADYIEALEHGMPPAIGFGMGIDRLIMLLTNTSSIKDVILFPTLRPEK